VTRLKAVNKYTIFSLGCNELVEHSNTTAATDLRAMWERHVSDDDLGKQVVRACEAHVKKPLLGAVPVSCLRFGEEREALRGEIDWKHSGTHYRNVERLCAHLSRNGANNMKGLLGWINREIVRRMAITAGAARPTVFEGHLILCLFCKSGRDRSVGAAAFFETLLKLKGWCGETHHVCKAGWRSNNDCRIERSRYGHCKSCAAGSADRIAQDFCREHNIELAVPTIRR